MGAQAAELGDIAPRSYIGQPLAVDIELVALTPEEAASLPVRLAQADVYRGANAAMHPALASVRMQVEKRGQKQMLHVTTTRAVEAEYVHLYVELGVPGKRMCGWPRCGCSRIRIRRRRRRRWRWRRCRPAAGQRDDAGAGRAYCRASRAPAEPAVEAARTLPKPTQPKPRPRKPKRQGGACEGGGGAQRARPQQAGAVAVGA
jgi:hypothetical protein